MNSKNKKTAKIVTHLEQRVYTAAKQIINLEHMSDSAYVRTCVIKDLVNRGLLTEQMVLELAM